MGYGRGSTLTLIYTGNVMFPILCMSFPCGSGLLHDTSTGLVLYNAIVSSRRFASSSQEFDLPTKVISSVVFGRNV
jgi:hypothetical protein